MKKYLLLIPLFGIFVPSYLNDWNKTIKENLILITVSFIIHILSISFITIICS